MKILITNDDGIKSENLRVLANSVKKHYPNDEIIVVAPETEQSAVSHAITIKNIGSIYPLPEMVEGVKTYMVDATPASCVLMAKNKLNYDFDLVFSGINNGLNIGIDVVYSGTCGAALEALRFCDLTIALSCNVDTVEGFLQKEEEIFSFIKQVKIKNTCLNINIPRNPKGFKLTFQEGTNRGQSDCAAIEQNYISITPIELDMTDYKKLEQLKTNIKF